MTNNEKIDAAQKVVLLYENEQITAEGAMAAITELVSPKPKARRDLQTFRDKVFNRSNDWKNVP